MGVFNKQTTLHITITVKLRKELYWRRQEDFAGNIDVEMWHVSDGISVSRDGKFKGGCQVVFVNYI